MTPGVKKTLGIVALVLSIVFFGLGMYFPLLSTHKQVIFRFGYEEMTIFRSIGMFFENGEYWLTGVILIFTVVMPVAKYGELIVRVVSGKPGSRIGHELDKWNMLDVFLVALLLLNFKMTSNIIVMQLKMGTAFIALAVVFRIVAITMISNRKIEHT